MVPLNLFRIITAKGLMRTIGVPLIAVIVYLARMKNSAKKHTYGRFFHNRKGQLLSFGNNGNSIKTKQYTLDFQ